MANKLIRGSLIIFIGNIIFRVGGYIYRFLMAILLGPVAYGNLGITLPFQGIFQTLSAGGLPPAIAKYVAEYEAVGEHDMAHGSADNDILGAVLWGIDDFCRCSLPCL